MSKNEKKSRDYEAYIKEFKEESYLNEEKQRKIIRRGKWRARFVIAFQVIGIFLLLSFVTSILTFFYYSSQSPIPFKQGEKLKRVIDYTYTITDPYGFAGTTSLEEGRYFTLKARRDQVRITGTERTKTGETEVSFFLSFMGEPKEGKFVQGDSLTPLSLREGGTQADWERLEKVDQGTVATVYISLAENLRAEEIEELLSEKELQPLWLALELDSHKNQPQALGVATSIREDFLAEKDSELVREYEDQFLQMVKYLSKHEKKANKLTLADLNFQEILDDLEQDGFHYYGILLTGPTKEILSLQEEPWIKTISVDGIDFWNWK